MIVTKKEIIRTIVDDPDNSIDTVTTRVTVQTSCYADLESVRAMVNRLTIEQAPGCTPVLHAKDGRLMASWEKVEESK